MKKNTLFRRKLSFQKPFSELLLRFHRPGLGHTLIPQLQGKLWEGVSGLFTSAVVMRCLARKKGQGDACWVGNLEHLPYFPGIWFSKHLMRAIDSNVQKSNTFPLSTSACFLCSLEAFCWNVEVLVLAHDTPSFAIISYHFATLVRA